MVKPLVDFHEQREPESIFIVQAICIGGVIIKPLPNLEDELCVVDMMGEFYTWQERGIYVPPTFLCLAHRVLHLLPELNRRLSIRRATDLLTRTGGTRGKPNHFSRLPSGR
jgi:hypothetical protein